uniref:Uncharacterized protein n=1 Tax=Onchocerca volvulus TaxID=6282 RepID=A0A8R1XVG3_ONCVO
MKKIWQSGPVDRIGIRISSFRKRRDYLFCVLSACHGNCLLNGCCFRLKREDLRKEAKQQPPSPTTPECFDRRQA